MISFEPSHEELTLRDTVHRFAADKIRPALRSAEEKGVPEGLGDRVRALGLALMALPASVGGADSGLRAIAVIEEELAWGDPGVATAFPRPGLAGYVLAALDERIQTRWLAPFVSANPSAPVAAVWAANREPAYDAQRKAGELTIEGCGDVLGDPSAADWILVSARLDGQLALIVVERGAPGLLFTPDRNPLGLRAASAGRLQLDHCKTPSGSLVASGPDAERALRSGLEREIGVWAARAVGTSRAAFEYAARYATERQTFGRSIAEHQAVGFMIADMGIEVEAARGLLWQAAWAVDNGDADASRLIQSAAHYAAEAAVRVTTDGVQVLGGHGYIQDHPVEKWMRDARSIANVINLLAASVPAVELAS